MRDCSVWVNPGVAEGSGRSGRHLGAVAWPAHELHPEAGARAAQRALATGTDLVVSGA